MFSEPFAQLCVHGTVLRFIESLFEDQHDHALEHYVRSLSDDVENVRDQLFKLLRRDLVKDPSDPSEHQIIVLVVFFVGLGGLFPSNSFGWGNPSSSCSGAGQLRCSTGEKRR